MRFQQTHRGQQDDVASFATATISHDHTHVNGNHHGDAFDHQNGIGNHDDLNTDNDDYDDADAVLDDECLASSDVLYKGWLLSCEPVMPLISCCVHFFISTLLYLQT